MSAAAPDPDLVARVKRAVDIRLREKREKAERARARGEDYAHALGDEGRFAAWYFAHLLNHQAEISEVEERERVRVEGAAVAETLRQRAVRRVSQEESPAEKAYRAMREGRKL